MPGASKVEQESAAYPWIAQGLWKLAFPVSQLVEDSDNIRLHSDRNIAVIRSSLREFTQDQPLVARQGDRVVIKGNGRLRAARELGWSHVAVVFVDDTQAEALRRSIADNRSGELATWELGVLGKHLKAEKDAGRQVDGMGFSDEEVASLLCGYQPKHQRQAAPEPSQSPPPPTTTRSQQESPPAPPQEEYTITISGVRWTDRDTLVQAIQELLSDEGLPYTVHAR